MRSVDRGWLSDLAGKHFNAVNSSHVWRRLGQFVRGGATTIENAEYGTAGVLNFEKTPIYFLLGRGETSGRWNIAKGEGVDDYPQLAEFAHSGGTDHLVSLLEFPKEAALRGVSLSLTSDRPGGFSDDQLAIVAKLFPALGLACYRIAATKTASDILAVYTGAKTSARILAGDIQREREGRSMLRSCLRT